MRKLISLIALLTFFSVAALVWAWSNITPQDAGYVVVTDYDGVDPTGANDSTAGLQTAINAARDSFKPLFFPNQDDNSQAIYTVNATLFAEGLGYAYLQTDKGEGDGYRCILVGSRKGGHCPVIKLADNTFTDTNDTQPVLWFWRNCSVSQGFCTQEQHDADDPLNNQIDINFYAQIRGIYFDLGNNPGAIAISFGTAQGSMISNLSINATNAYAGIENAGVLGPAVYDVEINGGRYAFWIDSTDWLSSAGQPAYYGVKCYDQTQAIMYSKGDVYSPILFTGFHFRNDSAIPVLDGKYDEQSSVCFVDGIIDINATAGFDILQFDTDRSVYMRNVYTKGIDNIEGNNITDTSNWCWVKEMSVMRRGSDEHNLVDGNSTHSGEVWVHEEGKTYTETQLIESLVDFHTWDYWSFPTFETTGAINITDAPYSANGSDTADDYNATQTALNDAAPDGVVIVPTGQWYLSQTLTLPDSVALIGSSSSFSDIRPLYSWQPDVSSGTPLLQTDDNASAAPKLAHLNIGAYWEDYERDGAIDTHDGKTDQFQFYSILWRAGADSELVNVNFAKAGDWADNTVTKFPFIKVTGNGGGKWFGTQGKTHHDFSLQERSDMLIEDTDTPLYLHGFNSHEDGPDYGIKITNSDNKFIYHFHTEGGETSFRAYNGDNIGLYDFRKNNDTSTGTNRAHVEFEDCTNATMAFRYSCYTPPSNTGFREDYSGSVTTFTGFMGLFKRGDPEYLEVGGITPPTVTTQAVTDIGGDNATGHATITGLGGDSNCTKRGICWDTGPNPTVENNKAEESGGFDTGAFSANMTGLSCGQHYYVRGYAYNSAGYGYGNQVEFDTNSCPAESNKRRMSGIDLVGVSIE